MPKSKPMRRKKVGGLRRSLSKVVPRGGMKLSSLGGMLKGKKNKARKKR